MTRRRANVTWVGFTEGQAELLEFLDYLGGNGWAPDSLSDAVMPGVLEDCEAAGLTLEQIKSAMASIEYEPRALDELDRWESKRTTARVGC